MTGTDTGCGKTFVCCEILNHLGSQGLDVVGLKPIASGADLKNGCLQNDDVKLLHKNSNIDIKEHDVCRYMFPEPCSPHIASSINNTEIDADYEFVGKSLVKSAVLTSKAFNEGFFDAVLRHTKTLFRLCYSLLEYCYC